MMRVPKINVEQLQTRSLTSSENLELALDIHFAEEARILWETEDGDSLIFQNSGGDFFMVTFNKVTGGIPDDARLKIFDPNHPHRKIPGQKRYVLVMGNHKLGDYHTVKDAKDEWTRISKTNGWTDNLPSEPMIHDTKDRKDWLFNGNWEYL